MATSNYEYAAILQTKYPHTYNAMTYLIPAMVRVRKNFGKKTFFGRDKGLEAMIEFDGKLKQMLFAMIMDNLIQRDSSSDVCLCELKELMNSFKITFPNWQDAYSFADAYFVNDEDNAKRHIEKLMS